VNVDETRPLERFQRRDRGHQLHAVVGGVRLAALELLLMIAEGENRAPAAGPRIAGAGAVGVDRDVWWLCALAVAGLGARSGRARGFWGGAPG
jgi:hypothetical protein